MPTLSERLMPHLRRAALARDSALLTDGQLLGAFVTERDSASFEALVRRHGPMVFGVCRRVIGHAQTAEDAFQAVFVVLARRAAAVKPREQLANWLFGVAYRTALKARGLLNRRRSREKQVDVMPDLPVATADLWTDIQPVLDEELAALPDHLRLPVVLCDLQGRTQRDAARHLQLPPATLANRLAAARRKLAERLTARGITLSGGLIATILGSNLGLAAGPVGGYAAAAQAGLSAVGVSAGVVPESVLQLSEGVLRMMMISKLKAVTGFALAGLLLVGGLGFSTVQQASAQQGTPAPKAKPVLGPNLSDAEFLKQTCATLRGTPATTAELGYFVADADANKRKKVVNWLTEAPLAPLEAGFKLLGDNMVIRGEGNSELMLDSVILWDVDNRSNGTTKNSSTTNTLRFLDTVLVDDQKAKPAEQKPAAPKAEPKPEPKVDKLENFHLELQLEPEKPKAEQNRRTEVRVISKAELMSGSSGDAEFLNKATTEARGSAPTKLESQYFLADKDPKKREKLLDLLLSDPAVAKKVGPDWKKNMLSPPIRFTVILHPGGADWSKLIASLQAAKKTDEQVLEALTLAIVGRLPTDTEKKLILGMVAKNKDKTAGWAEVAGTLSSTDEARKHAEKLKPDHNAQIFHMNAVGSFLEMNLEKPGEAPKPGATAKPEVKKEIRIITVPKVETPKK